MIENNEQDVATLTESMPIDLLSLIDLDKNEYQLFSHQTHRVIKENIKENPANWKCKKFKDANKCLSGLDDQGRVNATVRFRCAYSMCCSDGRQLYFCDKCVKADLLFQLPERIN